MTHLVWFRTDLRCADNPALSHACRQADAVVAVFFLTLAQWQQHGLGPRKIQLLNNRALTLQQELADRGIPLLILHGDTFSQSLQQLQTLCTDLAVKSVSFNSEYEVNERHRDIQFVHWCREQGTECNRFHDQCLLPPGAVETRQQLPFKVFTPFKKAWLPLAERQLSAPLAAPALRPSLAPELQQKISHWQQAHPLPAMKPDPLWPVTEDAAHDKLEAFIADKITDYKSQRDIPSAPATSQLSFELSLGILSPRQCLYSAVQTNHGQLSGGNAGADGWISELIWREFYRHLLVAFPQLCKHRVFKEDTESVRWRSSEEDFRRWSEGRTGYPIVDAAIIQLRQSGWMHNRLRMISAMFLSKHLLIDWRRGEAFFNYWLVDADFASNNGGWQWSASTGADGVPYFRIFNPVTQSERFDAAGEFIATMLPQLASLPAASRHWPSPVERQLCDYPQPVVEHKLARQRALDAFKNSRAENIREETR